MSSTGQFWTDFEIALLRRCANAHFSQTQTAAVLERTVPSVAQKAASLGIHFNCLVVGAPKNNRNAAGGPKMWRINAPN
jgi:hypothetical protein